MSEVTFNAFVVSLATTAAVHFGADRPRRSISETSQIATGSAPANLEGAGQAIEMLALLERKTAGNLTASEAAFLGQVLAELRRRLVEAHRQQEGPNRAGEDDRPFPLAT